MKLSRILFCFLHTKEGVICKIPHRIDRHKKDRRERSVEARRVQWSQGRAGKEVDRYWECRVGGVG